MSIVALSVLSFLAASPAPSAETSQGPEKRSPSHAPTLLPVAMGMHDSGSVRLVGTPQAERLFVTIESDNPKTELIQLAGGSVGRGFAGGRSVTVVTTYFKSLCRAPCNTEVQSDYRSKFILGGEGVPATTRFELSNYSGAVKIKVESGSPAKIGWGVALTSTGIVSALSGALLWGIGAALDASRDSYPGSSASQGSSLTGMGMAATGIGVAALIPGIWLMVTGGTKYQIEQQKAGSYPKSSPRPGESQL